MSDNRSAGLVYSPLLPILPVLTTPVGGIAVQVSCNDGVVPTNS